LCIDTHDKGRDMGFSSRTVIKKIEADGWILVNTVGSHKQFKYPTKPGRVTVPHLYKDLPIGTLKSIEKISGVKVS
jgi:predicted RNA binding protein YcfA (HicA-like mRNA interferase family)